MTRFLVEVEAVQEVETRAWYEVEAETAEEAKTLVESGQGDYVDDSPQYHSELEVVTALSAEER